MGCGSSGQALSAHGDRANGHAKVNGDKSNGHHNDHNDGLPTVVLPDTPAKPKPQPASVELWQYVRKRTVWSKDPSVNDNDDSNKSAAVAFEIPLEEFDGNRRMSTTPPPHLQRLLQPPQADISLPDIEEKLLEAELRRQSILQQRAASAQKRSQKMMKSFSEMDRLDSEHEPANIDSLDSNKHANNMLPPQPGMCEDKNIS